MLDRSEVKINWMKLQFTNTNGDEMKRKKEIESNQCWSREKQQTRQFDSRR